MRKLCLPTLRLLFLASFLVLLQACEEEDSIPPVLSTQKILYVGPYSASVIISTQQGTSPVEEYGIIYDTKTIESAGQGVKIKYKTAIANSEATDTIRINELTKKTTYYVRAYAISNNETTLGAETTFTTANTNEWTEVPALFRVNSTTIDTYLKHSVTVGNTAYAIVISVVSGQKKGSIYRFDSLTGHWEKITEIPGNIYFDYRLVTANSQTIYVGLGKTINDSEYDNSIWAYTVTTNTWRKLVDMPVAWGYGAPVSFVTGNKLYVGYGGALFTNNLWQYDAVSDTWLEKSKMNWDPYNYYSKRGEDFVFGFPKKAIFRMTFSKSENFDVLLEFNSDTNETIKLEEDASDSLLQIESYGATMNTFQRGDKGYLAYNSIFGHYKLWEYNSVSHKWTNIPLPDDNSMDAIGFAIGNTIYLFYYRGSKLYAYTFE